MGISIQNRRSQFSLRIPVELKGELKTRAAENGRSLNAELLFRLRQSLKEKRNDQQ